MRSCDGGSFIVEKIFEASIPPNVFCSIWTINQSEINQCGLLLEGLVEDWVR